MSIVATEIASDELVGAARHLRYRCQDSAGAWHYSGVVTTVDPQFDADAHKAVVAAKMAERLARLEAEELLS